ncbi:amidohydrolase [uncultured Shimia sp.]|uniref:amidohydrolase n=1 Tax=uncultured Shimia sp. TaxID=573152 RepID=UPI0025DD70BA|nr:amidohydrolase [uncultured Shimia sp.]
MTRLTATFGGLVLSTFLSAPLVAEETADTIYSGGPILTINDAAPRAEAVAVKNGRILAVGALSDMLAHQDDTTEVFDLNGGTMLPGFVDSHGHAVMGGLQALSANLLAPPDGEVQDIASLQDTLRAWIANNQPAIDAANLIVGFGYDQSQLAELRHPTKEDLDAVSTDVPIIIVHQSGHFGAANSAALAAADITRETPTPPGGVIRYASDGTPNGVLEENAFFLVLGKLMGGVGEEGFKAFARAGTQLWASFGYTTAQEGRATPEVAEIARAVAAAGELPVDLAIYPDILVDRDYILANQSDTYENGVRIAGAKLTIDGSPQGFTALRDRPYYDPVGNYPPGYKGYAAASEDQVNDAIAWAFANNIQILTHSNGEGASDMLLAAIDAAEQKHGMADRRPVLIHGQFLRRDQVADLQRLNVFPSLFPMHTFYWGDWHRDHTVGPINGDNISPTGWVRERGMMFGTHHDAPVAFPNSMRVLSATVTRRTRSGDILGPHQRVDVMTALKAMTLWPAYQHFEEDQKGSIEVGKVADFVILSDDPTAVDPETLADIKVQVTVKNDVEIYRAPKGPQKADLIAPMGHHILDVAHAATRKN